jgi:hypothetical protein
MLEALVAVVGIIVCWLIINLVYKEDMSLARYAILAFTTATAAYFAVRIIHWAWATPIPFFGASQ